MYEIVFFDAYNAETKYWGLKAVGLVIGAVLGIIAWMVTDQVIGIITSCVAYKIGAQISALLHEGIMQRWIYWHTPLSFLHNNKYIPPSHIRRFM